jgi:nucleotide-binding universal stress UspA family protein
MTILVATDGSRSSERSVDYASKLASRMRDSLLIMHVTPVLSTTKENMIHLLKEELGSQEEAGKKYLRRAAAIAKRRGIKVEVKLVKGSPAEEILKEAEKGHEILVIGHHGKGKIHELLLGGVASKIVNLSKIPVLVVR